MLITMTLINSLFVMGIVKYVSLNPSSVGAVGDQILSNSISNTLPSEVPVQVQDNSQRKLTKSPVQPTVSVTTKPIVAQPSPTSTSIVKTPVVIAVPTSAPTAIPTPKPAGCLIQIDGVKYEITSLQRSHSGGNVFTCGTDMSAIFWGKHNAKILQMMAKYKI